MILDRGKWHVVVPAELEGFVKYMFEKGYSERTIANVVENVRAVLRGYGFDPGSKHTRKYRQYAWRHYQRYLQEREVSS